MSFFKRKDPILIDGYQSYGSDNHLYVLGRALEHEGVNLKKKGILSTIKNSYRQFATDELRHTKLRITLPDNRVFYTTTDAEGYFKLDQSVEGLSNLANEEGWLQLRVSFDEVPEDVAIIDNNEFLCEMLIPLSTTEYGVISDIDDTILHTGVASMLKWRLILNTLFKNVRKRASIEGTPELYQKLHKGVSGKAANPIFYVSNSPWNLYNYLETFVRNHLFPRGPILLRDFRTPFEKTPKPSSAASDVYKRQDDTILHTGVASMLKWRLILNTLFKNVRKRASIEGTPELYQKLHKGGSGKAANPIFYVSNSCLLYTSPSPRD